jgi:hypothetical protein
MVTICAGILLDDQAFYHERHNTNEHYWLEHVMLCTLKACCRASSASLEQAGCCWVNSKPVGWKFKFKAHRLVCELWCVSKASR